MGYYIKNIRMSEDDAITVSEYIGGQTIYAVADSGAFDSPVSPELEELSDKQENIMAIVDANGIQHFLNTLKNNSIRGRDVQKLIEIVEEKLQNGFMIIS